MSLRIVLLGLFATLALSQSTGLCLPTAWQAFETIYTNSPNPQQENVAMMRWRDMTQMAERFDFMLFHNHQQRQAFQILDFNGGISYFVEEQMGNPTSCTLQKLSGTMQQECLFANATKVGSGFAGGTFAVDFWHEQGVDNQNAPFFLDATLQSNAPAVIPIQIRQVFLNNSPMQMPFFSLVQFWNYQAGTVNSTLFVVPSLCHGMEVSGVIEYPFLKTYGGKQTS